VVVYTVDGDGFRCESYKAQDSCFVLDHGKEELPQSRVSNLALATLRSAYQAAAERLCCSTWRYKNPATKSVKSEEMRGYVSASS